MSPTTEANETLDRLIRARYPIIAINSHEEIRVLRALESVVLVHNNKGKNRKIATWSFTQGLNGIDGEDPANYVEPSVALEFISHFDRTDVQYIFVMLDLHHALSQDSRAVRFMRARIRERRARRAQRKRPRAAGAILSIRAGGPRKSRRLWAWKKRASD